MKENVLSVRLEKHEREYLSRWAQNAGLTVSDVVRQVLRQAMYPSTLTFQGGNLTYDNTTHPYNNTITWTVESKS